MVDEKDGHQSSLGDIVGKRCSYEPPQVDIYLLRRPQSSCSWRKGYRSVYGRIDGDQHFSAAFELHQWVEDTGKRLQQIYAPIQPHPRSCISRG
jgi:hypothetical protein